MRVLTVNENIGQIAQKLSETVEAPVYICGCIHKFNGTHYLLPGHKRYTSMGSLELFLSPYTDNHRCVKRVDDVNGNGRDFYYDLDMSRMLHLTFPIKPKDFGSKHSESFASVGLAYRSTCTSVFLDADDREIPPALEPYITEIKIQHNRYKTGIRFVQSEPIEAPERMHKDWFVHSDLGITFLNHPGQYCGAYSSESSQFVVTQSEPGACIVCRGASGRRVHLAVSAVTIGAIYATSHVCLDCFKAAVPQWEAILIKLESEGSNG